MRIRLALLVSTCLAVASPSFAQDPDRASEGSPRIHFTLQPSVGTNIGYTKYVMDIFGNLDSTTQGQLKSALKFPLNTVMAGARFGISPSTMSHAQWSVEGGVFTNVNSPSNLMTDGDWETIPGVFSSQFSYTESDAKLTSVLISLEGYRSIWQKKSLSLDVMGGLRYQNINEDINGFSGWQLDTFGVSHNISGDGLVLTYKVTYKMPMIGLRGQMAASPNLLFSLTTAYSPFYVSDIDNHLLRNKIATAHGWGNGVLGILNARLGLGSRTARQMPFVDLAGEFTWMSASIPQTQFWYGDDPATPGDDTGLQLTNIPHRIISTQLHLSARVGMAF